MTDETSAAAPGQGGFQPSLEAAANEATNAGLAVAVWIMTGPLAAFSFFAAVAWAEPASRFSDGGPRQLWMIVGVVLLIINLIAGVSLGQNLVSKFMRLAEGS